MGDEFKCDNCQGVFKKGWTDADAMQEAKAIFDEKDLEDKGVLCNDCYEKFMRWYRGEKK